MEWDIHPTAIAMMFHPMAIQTCSLSYWVSKKATLYTGLMTMAHYMIWDCNGLYVITLEVLSLFTPKTGPAKSFGIFDTNQVP
jgi:hypothetical protein